MRHPLNTHPLIVGYIDWNRYGKLIGMDFEILEPGKVEYSMAITPDLLATPVSAHGGAIASLMDATVGVAALSKVCESGCVVSTITLSMQFLVPARKGDQLIATGTVTKAGKRLLFVSGTISNQDGVELATAQATLNAYPAEKVVSG